MPLKNTSMNVDEDKWRRVKIQAAKEDLKLCGALDQAITDWLTKHE